MQYPLEGIHKFWVMVYSYNFISVSNVHITDAG